MDVEPCQCEVAKKNNPLLTNVIVFAFNHGLKLPEDFECFVYCPWCGKKLITNCKGEVL